MSDEKELAHEDAPLAISADVQHIIDLAAPLEELANKAGIFNVFDDGGYRTLLILTMFGLRKPPGRLGDDAIGSSGKRYELKTINLINTRGETRKSYPGITTEHTLRATNVERYRQTNEWLIGVFKGNVPVQVWQLESKLLEPYYLFWEKKIRESKSGEINNPKILFGFVHQHGKCHPLKGAKGSRFPIPASTGSSSWRLNLAAQAVMSLKPTQEIEAVPP
jgi:hypothetical protein